jgi:hypothetical protein
VREKGFDNPDIPKVMTAARTAKALAESRSKLLSFVAQLPL